MAVAFKAVGALASAAAPGAFNVPQPALVAGDYLVMLVDIVGTTTDPTVPVGWGEVGTDFVDGSLRRRSYWRYETGTVGATNISVTAPSGTSTIIAKIVVFTGANNSAPTVLDVANGSAAYWQSPSLTATSKYFVALALVYAARTWTGAFTTSGTITSTNTQRGTFETISGFRFGVATYDVATASAGFVRATLGGGSATSTVRALQLPELVAPSEGTVSGGFAFAGSASGAAPHEGTVTGGFAYAGAATGGAPALPPNDGTAAGGFAYTGSASGVTDRAGASSGGFAYTGSGAGGRDSAGTSGGGFAYEGAATGTTDRTGQTSGGFTYTGSASGGGDTSGSVAGGFTYAGSATGGTTRSGTTAGGFAYTGAATSSTVTAGTTSGGFLYVGSTAGVRVPVGSVAGGTHFTGTTVGQSHPAGSAAGTWAFAGASTGSSSDTLRNLTLTVEARTPRWGTATLQRWDTTPQTPRFASTTPAPRFTDTARPDRFETQEVPT